MKKVLSALAVIFGMAAVPFIVMGVLVGGFVLFVALPYGPTTRTVTEDYYGKVRFTSDGWFQTGEPLERTRQEVAVHVGDVSSDLTAIVYDGHRIELSHDGNDLEKIRALFKEVGGQELPRDYNYPEKNPGFTYQSPGFTYCGVQVYLNPSNEITGMNIWGDTRDGVKEKHLQIEFRGKLLWAPFKRKEVVGALGEPDRTTKTKVTSEMHVW